MKVVRVQVVVREDGVEVADYDIAYFERQPYSVLIVTPDGLDYEIKREVGSGAPDSSSR